MGSIQPHPWQRLMLAAVAALGIAVSAILAVHFSDMEIEARRLQSMVEATGFADDLEQYLQSREMIAKTIGAVFEAPALSQPHPLGSIGKKILALTPEIDLMAWIPQVDPARVQEVFSALSAAGRPPQLYGPNYETLDVTGTRRVLYPVVDIEPNSDDRKVGLGMEIGLFPSRKTAFEQARDEQRVIATPPVGLLQPLNAIGYILFSPVYSERGFVGCITFVFRVDQLLNGFAHARRIPMNFRVYDATDPGQLIVGVTRQGEIQTVNSSVRSGGAGTIRQTLDFAGRKILVLFDPGPDLVQAGLQQALIVGCLGLILTGIILWGIYYFMRASRRLAAEIETSNSMKESLLLMNRELIHRVGNLLAVAQGIIRLSYDASLGTLEFRDSIIARLHALHQSVGLINREDWKGVWLHELLQTELAPVMDRIDLSGRDALLKPKAAQSLSLLFYELMTNSSKHGALSKQGGKVTAEWEIRDSDSGRLFYFRWQEHDHGVVKPPTRQGFGTKLLTRLVPGDLSGQATLNYESGSFRYELEAPVERVVEQESNAAVIVKAVVPLCVASGHSAADELVA
jgi:two-component sensor histidine kinase